MIRIRALYLICTCGISWMIWDLSYRWSTMAMHGKFLGVSLVTLVFRSPDWFSYRLWVPVSVYYGSQHCSLNFSLYSGFSK